MRTMRQTQTMLVIAWLFMAIDIVVLLLILTSRH